MPIWIKASLIVAGVLILSYMLNINIPDFISHVITAIQHVHQQNGGH